MSDIPYDDFEPVIGLEIHVQLNTRTKLFSRAPNSFGAEPNTNIGIVDTGQPGSLPVLNREAVKKAVMFGLAANATVSPISRFDRKSYFYPDSPRNFQITQFSHPIIKGGSITAKVDGKEKEFAIHHAHLEDDAGMLKHFNHFAGVDYNRAGVPLIEIVSGPCMRSPKEASAYAQMVRAIMLYLDCSDCNMEEGSLRIDVNVSVRKKGEAILRNKVEIKNMNSFSNLELALESEIRRQIKLYVTHPHTSWDELIPPATYRFDLETNQTVMMRKKESADDYRYFPEPDLPPIRVSPGYIEELRRNLPELPLQRFSRYVEKLDLGEYFANLLINDKPLCDLFEEGLKYTSNAKGLCNWLTVEFAGRIKEMNKTLAQIGVKIEHVASLVNMIEAGTITGKIAKSVADDMIAKPGRSPEEIVNANPDYKPIDNTDEIEKMVDQVLGENPESIADFKLGKDKAFNFLVGQVMKLCKGKATPSLVRDIMLRKMS